MLLCLIAPAVTGGDRPHQRLGAHLADRAGRASRAAAVIVARLVACTGVRQLCRGPRFPFDVRGLTSISARSRQYQKTPAASRAYAAAVAAMSGAYSNMVSFLLMAGVMGALFHVVGLVLDSKMALYSVHLSLSLSLTRPLLRSLNYSY